MSAYDIDRTLADWFEADAMAPVPADARERALDGVRLRQPRPAWLAGPGSHWGPEAPIVRSRVAVPALIVVALLGVLLGGLVLAGAPLFETPTLPAPRLGALAYVLDGDIFVADWDGQHPVRVADGASETERRPCGPFPHRAEGSMWSPDGRYLAYRHGRVVPDRCQPRAESTIRIHDSNGAAVASLPGVGWAVPWSPDSTRVATWLDVYPSTRISVYGLDGVTQAVVSVPEGMAPEGDFDPVWSPDGQSLWVPLSDYPELWELPIDGSPPRKLPIKGILPVFSPDGRQVAYGGANRRGTSADPRGGESLFVAETDGSQQRELVDGELKMGPINAVWSPTGERIAFVASEDIEDPYAGHLHIIDVASGAVTVLDGSDDVMYVIALSPEGDRILYARSGAGGDDPSLWSVDLDGSEPQQLVDGTYVGDWQSVTADP